MTTLSIVQDVPLNPLLKQDRDFGLQNLCRKPIRNHLVVTRPKTCRPIQTS